MSDWKQQLEQAYQHISKIKKDTKPSDKTAKDNLENFRGKKGVNDSGIPLTERANKKLRKNRLNYKKYNYSGSRLQFINDARAEAARKHRMGSPQHSERVNKILELADREIQKDHDQKEYQRRINRSCDGSFDKNSSSFHYMGRGYSIGSEMPEKSVEVDLSGAKSVLDREPEFRNKVEENIWRLKNKK